MTRSTPAARARSSTAGASAGSRCACVSITPQRALRCAGRAARRPGCVPLQPFSQRPQLVAAGPVALELAVEELLDHLRRPREQVAEVVAELAFVALVQSVDRGGSVLAEVDRARTPVADGVGAVDVDQVEWVDDVPERLRDLPV